MGKTPASVGVGLGAGLLVYGLTFLGGIAYRERPCEVIDGVACRVSYHPDRDVTSIALESSSYPTTMVYDINGDQTAR